MSLSSFPISHTPTTTEDPTGKSHLTMDNPGLGAASIDAVSPFTEAPSPTPSSPPANPPANPPHSQVPKLAMLRFLSPWVHTPPHIDTPGYPTEDPHDRQPVGTMQPGSVIAQGSPTRCMCFNTPPTSKMSNTPGYPTEDPHDRQPVGTMQPASVIAQGSVRSDGYGLIRNWNLDCK
ncbi:hypothetical protein BD769DRAFT_1663026 [Suillus cothurnatus]|nr:hypothetical protein BD769DRAFT_1663026 [Suillus cothurnatus]